jgi:hypothetical protein
VMDAPGDPRENGVANGARSFVQGDHSHNY